MTDSEFQQLSSAYMAHQKPALLPCPFCGVAAKINSDRDPTKVGCFNTKCGVKPRASSTCENTAVRNWNSRGGRQV